MISALVTLLLALPPQCREFPWKCMAFASAPAAVMDLQVASPATSMTYSMTLPTLLGVETHEGEGET